MSRDKTEGSFWDHLDILRTAIIKIIAVWVILSLIAFLFKQEVFDFILAPKTDSFITYRIIDSICRRFGFNPLALINIELINTGLAQQFVIHVQTAMCVGLILTAPYALYEIFKFISPGLYSSERRYTLRIIVSSYIMFLIGLGLSYFLIFPMTFQFLGAYQVADDVVNLISLDSYMATMIIMSLCMGVVCELPVLAWLLAKMGLINSSVMTRYRKHAIVIILIVAAVITPTSDIFTLLMVSVPIWILYEMSVLIVSANSNKERKE
ncbi:MAG: twin-arginine translocase subunit TatC [Muribaculaceae bacterium]|nr:twin-arginine translocase subunit TatC [Muribaculaceae bacterium]